MVIKERPNKTIREYGKVTKAGVVLVKKRNPTLTTSPWKKRAMGLYGTLLVFSEVGHEDQVKEDDQVTEELPLPRSAQVVMHTVLGVPCVCVETSRQPIIFRPVDERQVQVLHEWAEAIRSAVMPPEPGTVDPMIELEALMQRKDLTPSEAQRAQALMRERGSENLRIQNAMKPVAKELLPSHSAGIHYGGDGGQLQAASMGTNASGNSMHSWGDGQSLFGQQHASSVQGSNMSVPHSNRSIFDDDVFAGISDFTGQSNVVLPSASEASGALNIFAGHASVPMPQNRSLPLSADIAAPVVDVNHQSQSAQAQSAKSPPPSDATLSTVHDGDGNYYGCITRDGTCLNSDGVCIGYLNDAERTAGSSRGEYLGCVSEARRGEAIVETPNGLPIAKIDLGFGRLLTLGGSTVAEFRSSGDVVADLGHQICRFDALTLHDQPIMSLYLSFLAPDLLQAAASKVHGSNFGPVQIPSSTVGSTVDGSKYGATQLTNSVPVPNAPGSSYGTAQLQSGALGMNMHPSNYSAAQVSSSAPVSNTQASNYSAAPLPSSAPVPNVIASNYSATQLPSTALVSNASNHNEARIPKSVPIVDVPVSNLSTAQVSNSAPVSNLYALNHSAADLSRNVPASNVPVSNLSTTQVSSTTPMSNVQASNYGAVELAPSAPVSTVHGSSYSGSHSFGSGPTTNSANYVAAQDQNKGNVSTLDNTALFHGAIEAHGSNFDPVHAPNNTTLSHGLASQKTNTAPIKEEENYPTSLTGASESTAFPMRQSEVPESLTTADSNNKSHTARSRYVAIANFDAECADWQVSIVRGEVCRLVEDHGDGWTTVQLEKTQMRGAVPTAFIEEAIDAIPSETQSNNDSSLPPPLSYTRAQVAVAHSFEAQDSSWQVTVTQGEQISVINDYDDGWTEVAKSDGSKGMVPTAFLRL